MKITAIPADDLFPDWPAATIEVYKNQDSVTVWLDEERKHCYRMKIDRIANTLDEIRKVQTSYGT